MLKAGPKDRGVAAAVLPLHMNAVEFAEHTCGPLYSWQRPLVEALCAEGRPRVAYVQVARKNGKSRLAATIALDGMCRGDQVFLISDSERNLKSALFQELNELVRGSDVLSGAVLLYKDHLECPGSGGRISLRPNNLSASQSINPSLVIFDEVHMQKTDSIWNGMMLATAAKPGALLLGITTPGYDVLSLAHDLYEDVKSGTLWGVVHEPDDPNCALDDPAAILQANPVLVERPDMAEVFEFERGMMPEHDYRRFRLGQWTTTASAWLPYGHWGTLARDIGLLSGERVWLGFDGSYSGDSTALVACTEDGHVCVLGVWANPGSRGWRVPREDVETAVVEAFNTYDVVAMYCDPPYWGAEIARWDQLWPGRVIEFPTHARARMAPACTAFYAAAMDGTLTHDGNPTLARHLANCVVKPTPQGDVVTKQDPMSPAKIDCAVAAVLAVQGALTSVRRGPVFVL